MSNDIHEILGIRKLERDKPEASTEIVPVSEVDIEQRMIEESAQAFDLDFITARNNMLFVMSRAKKALEEIELIAKEKEDAKSYDALNNLLKTMNETSKTLMEMHEKRKKFKEQTFKPSKKTDSTSVNVENAVFVGSSTQMQAYLETLQNKVMKDITNG